MAVIGIDGVYNLVHAAARLVTAQAKNRWGFVLGQRIVGASIVGTFVIFYTPYALTSVSGVLNF